MEQSAGNRYRNIKELQIDQVLFDYPENAQNGGLIPYLLSLCMLPIFLEREWPQNKGFVIVKSVKLHADGIPQTRARCVKLLSRCEAFFSVIIQSTFLVVVSIRSGLRIFRPEKACGTPSSNSNHFHGVIQIIV